MRYIPSTKRIITVGNSNGVTTGFETDSFGKTVGDYYGVIVMEPQDLEEAKALLDADPIGRYHLSVSKRPEGVATEVVYDYKASVIRSKDDSIFTVIGPFDDLSSCLEFKELIGDADLTERGYEEAYYKFIRGA